MKKLFIALTFALPIMFVSCEKEPTPNNNNNQTTSGFWDVECSLDYDSVATTTCDSVWISDSSSGQWVTECDTIVYCSLSGNSSTTIDCKQVWYGNNNQNGGYYSTTNCVTTYALVSVQACDSVWVSDSVSTGNNGSWQMECDSVYGNSNQLIYQCDSVWVTAIN